MEELIEEEQQEQVEIIKERSWNDGSRWHFHRSMRLNHCGGKIIQLAIVRDGYDSQSFARVDVWDGFRWNSMIYCPITDCRAQKISYLDATVTEEDFYEDATRLLKEAEEILLPKPFSVPN